MRKGQVLAYNKTAGVGLIDDTNNERIKFYTEGKDQVPARGDQVSFKISLLEGHLVVSEVYIIDSPIPLTISFRRLPKERVIATMNLPKKKLLISNLCLLNGTKKRQRYVLVHA